MIDARGITLPEGVLHPHGPCDECGRIMVRAKYRGTCPPGTVRFAAAGICNTCYAAARADGSAPSQTSAYVSIAGRGEPRTEAENRAALEGWTRDRRRRLARSQSLGLASALSTGWAAL